MSNVWQSIAGFPDFLAYFAFALAILALFVTIYVRATPYREFALIREGNIAAAISLSAASTAPAASKIQAIVSPGGIKAWLVREPSVPMVALDFAFSIEVTVAEPLEREVTSERNTILNHDTQEAIPAVVSPRIPVDHVGEPAPTGRIGSGPIPEQRSVRVAPAKIDHLLDVIGEAIQDGRRLAHAGR